MSAQPVPPVTLRDATRDDAAAIAAIYNHYVLHTTVTFEETAVDADEIARRMESVWSSGLPWLVAEHAGVLVGYAYATKWKERIGYRFSVEASVYLAVDAAGRGVGSALYQALFPMLSARGIHAVIGGIALPNAASIALHEKMGMQQVAHFRETGTKFGAWVDVGYWEALLPTVA